MANNYYPEQYPKYMDTDTGVIVQPGTAKLAEGVALVKDGVGFTHPNLHRRIDPQDPPEGSDELLPREYTLNIQSGDSYRTTTITVHDEESTTSEIP